MNNRFRIIILIFLISSIKIAAQVDKYTVDIKLGVGRSKLTTFGATNELFGNQWGTRIFVGIGYKGLHLNAGIQGYNEGILKSLDYEDIIIPQDAHISNQYVDFSISYEYEPLSRLIIEPSIGYARVRTVTNINEPNGDEFKLKSINGFSTGVSVIKYLRFEKGFYLGPFINLSYDFIGYNSWNNNLDNNSIRMSFGIVLKGTN